MKVEKLGHVVLQVRDRVRSEAFYHGVLGLPIAARYEPVKSTFFSVGSDHHCFAIIEVGDAAPLADPKATGLRHFAFRLGDSTEILAVAKRELEANGIPLVRALDHGITHSLYVKDPDGNVVEVYVDVSDDWKVNPESVVLTPKPLDLA